MCAVRKLPGELEGGLRVGNGVKRLVHAHGQALEEARMAFIETNARAFHTEAILQAMLTLSVVVAPESCTPVLGRA